MTKERKRIIIFGIVLLLMGAAYRFMPDISHLVISETETVLKTKKLKQYQQMLSKASQTKARHDAIDAALKKVEMGLLRGNTSALAAVDMQNIIKAVVFETGCEVKSLQVLKSGEPDLEGYVSIPVKFQVISTARQIKDILYGIESAEKLFRITELNLRASPQRSKKGEPTPTMIRSIITVEGYVSQG